MKGPSMISNTESSMLIYSLSCGSPLWGKLGTCSLELLPHGAPTLCQDLHQVPSLMSMLPVLYRRDWGGHPSLTAGKVVLVDRGWGRLLFPPSASKVISLLLLQLFPHLKCPPLPGGFSPSLRCSSSPTSLVRWLGM